MVSIVDILCAFNPFATKTFEQRLSEISTSNASLGQIKCYGRNVILYQRRFCCRFHAISQRYYDSISTSRTKLKHFLHVSNLFSLKGKSNITFYLALLLFQLICFSYDLTIFIPPYRLITFTLCFMIKSIQTEKNYFIFIFHDNKKTLNLDNTNALNAN